MQSAEPLLIGSSRSSPRRFGTGRLTVVHDFNKRTPQHHNHYTCRNDLQTLLSILTRNTDGIAGEVMSSTKSRLGWLSLRRPPAGPSTHANPPCTSSALSYPPFKAHFYTYTVILVILVNWHPLRTHCCHASSLLSLFSRTHIITHISGIHAVLLEHEQSVGHCGAFHPLPPASSSESSYGFVVPHASDGAILY